MNITPASAAAFAVICVALWLGWLWHEYTNAPLLDDPGPDVADLPMLDAAAAILVEQLMPEIEQHLQEQA